MAWYFWLIILIILTFFGLMIFALLSANEPFREDNDKAQMEWLKTLNKQKKKE